MMREDLRMLGQLRHLELLQEALGRLTEPENRSAMWLGAMSRDQLLAWLTEPRRGGGRHD